MKKCLSHKNGTSAIPGYAHKYCSKCGAATVWNRLGFFKYSASTGEPIYYAEIVCPNKTWRFDGHYQARRITWYGPDNLFDYRITVNENCEPVMA